MDFKKNGKNKNMGEKFILQREEEDKKNILKSLEMALKESPAFWRINSGDRRWDYEVNSDASTQFSWVWLSVGSNSSPQLAASLPKASDSQDMNMSLIKQLWPLYLHKNI